MRSDVGPTSANLCAAERDASVDRYLRVVRNEQQRFLDALEQARQELDPADGQLAHVAAIQGRLARQFLDGQRAILRRRAETDVELAGLAADAERRADELVDIAMSGGDVFDVELLEAIEADVELLAVGQRSVRHDLAAFGTSVVRTSDDARRLADVLDEAMKPDDPDGLTAARQLGSVLDQWWHQANDEAHTQLQDAHARSAIRLHVAAVEVREMLPARPLAPPSLGDQAVDHPALAAPSALSSTLRSADDAGLETLLSELELALDDTPARPGRDLAIRDELLATPAVSSEPYEGFWPSRRRAKRVGPGWMPTHVVLPMITLTVGMAIVMAWIG